MLVSSVPAKISLPFGANAGGSYIRSIPTPSQIGITNGAASFNDGFPPWCFNAGGAPSGLDFNGVLNQITAWNRWQAAGGPVYYDATFASNIGGYPAGAVVSSVSTQGQFWLNQLDNNSSNPDTGGANWLLLSLGQTANDVRYVRQIPLTTFYVSPSGNDSNPGTAGSPFLTIQGAINYISQFQSSSTVTINVASGTYTPAAGTNGISISRSLIASWNIVGAGAGASIINATNAGSRGVLLAQCTVTLSGFTLSGNLEAVNANNGAYLQIANCNISLSSGTVGLSAYNGAYILAYGTIQFNGTTAQPIILATTGAIIQLGYHDVNTTDSLTMTTSGTVTGAYTVEASLGGTIQVASGYCTFSGTWSGTRYVAVLNGTINVNGAGVNFFPGTVAGSTTTGGQYA